MSRFDYHTEYRLIKYFAQLNPAVGVKTATVQPVFQLLALVLKSLNLPTLWWTHVLNALPVLHLLHAQQLEPHLNVLNPLSPQWMLPVPSVLPVLILSLLLIHSQIIQLVLNLQKILPVLSVLTILSMTHTSLVSVYFTTILCLTFLVYRCHPV